MACVSYAKDRLGVRLLQVKHVRPVEWAQLSSLHQLLYKCMWKLSLITTIYIIDWTCCVDTLFNCSLFFEGQWAKWKSPFALKVESRTFDSDFKKYLDQNKKSKFERNSHFIPLMRHYRPGVRIILKIDQRMVLKSHFELSRYSAVCPFTR